MSPLAIPRGALPAVLGLFLLASCNTASSTAAGPAAMAVDLPVNEADAGQLTWPRVFDEGGVRFSVYQPQIERWDGVELASRAAVAAEPLAGGAPVYGIIEISGTTDVDKAAGLVTLRDLRVERTTFPTAHDKEPAYLELLRRHVPSVRTIALDHLEASFAISQAVRQAQVVPVKNEPPRILFSDVPALLVLVDGPPVLRPVQGLEAQRVLNTSALIVKVGPRLHLAAAGRWFEAAAIEGPWTLSTMSPDFLEALRRQARDDGRADLMEPEPGVVPAAVPAIFVSTVPAELIQTDGTPQLLPIEGTQLLQVNNTDSVVLMDLRTNAYYVLASGRWFRSKSLESGRWAFVAGKDLPADFARIPADHPRANALVSVPGTPRAQEAVIANSIPQTAAVGRTAATADLAYDGPPDFVSIETSPPIAYAVNSRVPVIRVNAQSYYCVQNGVWFWAPSPLGPWTVADYVPPVIYAIPPSCPIYYATFVRVYGSTPQVVYVGYTPGYLGAVVSPDYVVVYGTGYYYPPYVGANWIGWPWTYGFGVGFACGWETGFGFGYAAGFGRHHLWPHPWWGPVGWGWRHGYHYAHENINRVNVYDHWQPGAAVRRPVVVAPVQPGPSVQRREFNPYRPPAQPAPQGARPTPAAPTPENNVYAGGDGHVYRHSDGTGWQQNTPHGWRGVGRDPGFQAQRPQLEREQQSRGLGQQRFNGAPPRAAAPPSPGARGGDGPPRR